MERVTEHPLAVAIAVATTGAALVVATLAVKKKKSPPETFIGNSFAKGSDIVTFYEAAGKVKGKTYLITGATSGFGKHMAILLGNAGANLILGVRNVQQANEEVIQRIINSGGGNNGQQQNRNHHHMIALHLDLSSFDSVRKFVKDIQSTIKKNFGDGCKIHGIINNAGVLGMKGQTVDGYQATWQINALAPALLTQLLLPMLSDDGGRIINVSSEMSRMAILPWETNQSIVQKCPPSFGDNGGDKMSDYSFSKAYQVLHAYQLTLQFHKEEESTNSNSKNQRRRRRRAIAVEPGLVVHTNAFRHQNSFTKLMYNYIIGPMIGRTIDQGCATPLFCLLASDEDLGGDNINNDNNVPNYYYANCKPTSLPTKSCGSKKEVDLLNELHSKIFKN